MQMDPTSWITLIILSTFLGISLVNFLTVHPLKMSLWEFIVMLTLVAQIWVLFSFFDGIAWLGAVGSSLLFVFGGYSIRARQVLSREYQPSLPKLERQRNDPGSGHTAVIYLTHGEPETFNPVGWLNQFREFDQRGVAFVPWLARPIFIYKLRQAYLKVGQSHHRRLHVQMINKLEQCFRAEGDTDTQFHLSFLDDEPGPEAALISALNDGASRIVVVQVFVSASNHTLEGENIIRSTLDARPGIPMKFTTPLWDSAPLQESFVAKTEAALGGAGREEVGIILVGHGQPVEWDQIFPTETEHELRFREHILKRLEDVGYRRENLGLAWMEFREPRPAKVVETLVNNGVKRILYFAAAISADSIHSQYDIPELIRQAGVPPDLPLINLGAWNDHQLVIQAIKEKVDIALKSN